MKLPDNEIRDLVRLLENGQPLPDKYRFLLFDDKREVELLWNGKTNEVCNVVLPFQTIEQIDEPRKEQQTGTGDLFGADHRGRQVKGWTNKLIWGDNRLILSSLKNGPLRREIEAQGGLKLIYIDPPFDVGADFSIDIEIGDEEFTKQPSVLEELAYRDTWGKGADSFIAMIYERLVLMYDLLAPDGSIYVHCDWRVNSIMRLAIAEIFGSKNFRNEIIRIKCNPKNYTTSSFGNIHDNILFFAKSPETRLNKVYEERDDEQSATDFSQVEAKTGRFYTTVALHAKGIRQGPTGRPWRGIKPPSGRHWAFIPETLDKLDLDGLIEWSTTGNPRLKRFADEDNGKSVQTVWEYKDQGDRTADYATQKPEALLERIIKASSNPGDLIADFFCGSGTTFAVAEKLGRKWIGTDLGKFAIHTTRKRMIGVQRELKTAGQDYRAFEILNLGRYERQLYVGLNPNLREAEQQAQQTAKEQQFVQLILHAYRAEPTTGQRVFQGRKADRMVAIGPVNMPVTRLFVEEVIGECRRHYLTKVDLLAFEFEMGLFPTAQEDAKQKGIDLAIRYIPREVFDKRAVDRGEVVFHDVAYVEVETHPEKEPRTISVELTDFSVFYNQDSAMQAETALKPGGSRIVVDNGQIVKLSKAKDGTVTREQLTKRWSDWIDYWAVDFDLESKRELIRVQRAPAQQLRLDGTADPVQLRLDDYEEIWTGDYVFENEWQSFRTRRSRTLEFRSAPHTYPKPGRYKIAVKVVDIFGNDTMKVVEVTV